MLKILKFDTRKRNIWFFSDIHGRHEKDFILNPRGFKTADEGLETLINNWNSKVSNNDICFLLGDTVVGAGNKGEEEFKSLLKRLNYAHLFCMPGNHFSGYKDLFYNNLDYGIDEYYRLTFRGKEHEELMNGLVHFIPNYYEILVDNQLIILSHYPIYSWREIGRSSWMIHGHCHSKINGQIKGKILDVGPESIGNFPISFAEIKLKMDKISKESPDYH